ncbi:Gfo/Idh/MocA family protein [Labilibaculum euxinus]|nr:Gfo/Idh/MocA family oxidoreductase [Labilibaculum euxinus]
MMKSRKIRFGIVGMGHIGKRHLEMIRCNNDAEIVACCDLLPLEELELYIPGIPFYRNYDEMLLNHKEMDVVNVCVPNGLHANMSINALNMGYHVVCEKPMALSKSDAERMLYKSLEVSRHIFVVKQNRYSPPAIWLKEIMNQECLGQIYMVQLSCFWNRDEQYYQPNSWRGRQKEDGGTLFTQFSHFIDIVYWLFGDIKNVKGIFKDFKHAKLTDFEDSGVVSFEFVNGGIGCLNYSTAVYKRNLESSIIIIGEKGTIKVAGQYMNEVVYCDIENYTMPELKPSNPPIDYGAYKGSAQNHHYVIANVVDKIQNNGVIATNALEGLKVVDIIERIYQLRDLIEIKQKNEWVRNYKLNGVNQNDI